MVQFKNSWNHFVEHKHRQFGKLTDDAWAPSTCQCAVNISPTRLPPNPQSPVWLAFESEKLQKGWLIWVGATHQEIGMLRAGQVQRVITVYHVTSSVPLDGPLSEEFGCFHFAIQLPGLPIHLIRLKIL